MDRPPRILIACERSGIVRSAFLALGYDAWSCDIEAADDGSNRHIRDDVRKVMHDGWDLMACMHPPCTRLTNSGVRWLHKPPPGRTKAEMWAELDEGAALFSDCWNAPIPRVAIEKALGTWFSNAARDAGISKGKTLHGIRKLLSVTMAENGAPAEQRMAILGHETEAEARNYSKTASLKKIISGTKFSNSTNSVGKSAK